MITIEAATRILVRVVAWLGLSLLGAVLIAYGVGSEAGLALLLGEAWGPGLARGDMADGLAGDIAALVGLALMSGAAIFLIFWPLAQYVLQQRRPDASTMADSQPRLNPGRLEGRPRAHD